MLFRIVFLLFTVATIGGAAYLSHYGIWRESLDLNKSVRTGSSGGGYIGGTRVK